MEGRHTDNTTGINNILTPYSNISKAIDNKNEKKKDEEGGGGGFFGGVIHYLKSGMQIACKVGYFYLLQVKGISSTFGFLYTSARVMIARCNHAVFLTGCRISNVYIFNRRKKKSVRASE